MTKTQTLTAAAVALTVLATPFVMGAQAAAPQAAAPQPRAFGDGAISIGADDGEMTASGFTLRGRAEVIQGQNRLRANAIQGTGTANQVQRIEASGEVYFVTPEQTIRGDRAVYTLANNEVVVTGDVILTQGQNVLTGGRLVYNTRTESARIEGGSNGARIRGVFYPDNSGN